MIEKFTPRSVENPNEKQKELKRRLLLGELSVATFLEKVFELDQSNPSRDESSRNAELLVDPEVVKKVAEDEDAQFQYNNLLSVSHFHLGQLLLMEDPVTALSSFEAALVAAEKIEEEDYEDWKNYIRATIAYLQKDIARLEEIHAKLEDGANKQIIGNMLKGLKENGEINYERDYRR